MAESAIAEPAAFGTGFEEVDFDSLGLAIRVEGVDWGEASITPQMVKQAQGELSSSGHRQGVQIKIPLRVKEESDIPLALAAYKLESLIARWQEQGGFLERAFESELGFAGALGYRIIRHTASIAGLQGWLFAHRRDAPDVIITATRWPIGFSPEQFESEPTSVTDARHAIIELQNLGGTVPGLIEWHVANDSDEDLRAVLLALECDDFSTAETAAPYYDASALTPKGGGTVIANEFTPPVPADCVICPPLTPGWQTVLSSQIEGVGHMTHTGRRRILILATDTSTASQGDVQWKLEYRSLGAAAWIQTMTSATPIIVSSPVIGSKVQFLDFGIASPGKKVIGDQRWEFRVQARSLGITHPRPLLFGVYPLPAEQSVQVADTSDGAIDGEPVKAPGTVEDATGIGTVAWSEPEKAKVLDGDSAFAVLAGKEASSHYLEATDFGHEIPTASDVLGILVTIYCEAGTAVFDNRIRLIQGGVVKSTVDRARSDKWPLQLTARQYGGTRDLWEIPWTPAQINASDTGVAISVRTAGEIGVAYINLIEMAVAYAELENENRVCFASRSLVLRSDGCFRQHPTEDVWGRMIEEGSPPLAPPGRLEDRPARAIVIASQGDLAANPELGAKDFTVRAKWHRGYLFAREAAS